MIRTNYKKYNKYKKNIYNNSKIKENFKRKKIDVISLKRYKKN